MEKIKVLIFVESRYKANRKRIKAVVSKLLEKQEIHSVVEVSIAIVGDRKMRELSKKYKGDNKTRNVLSFSQTEGQRMVAPNGILRLGDVVISFPQVIRDASEDEMLVDDKIDELVEHGLLHLLGIHHE
ncbi:rRNA maturation RNase YbeY [Patescibacteria group bacterium]|nr:rRNA maturation RNase YbeY [Patescibacteria group bacterium]